MTTRRDALTAIAGAGLLAGLQAPGPAITQSDAKAAGSPAQRKVGAIIQHGYVVRDARAAALQWAERAGIGPFYVFEQPIENYVYRGKPTPLTMRTAIGYWQDMQIELIEQMSPEKTFYSESLRKRPNRLNHYAVMVPDIDAAIVQLDAAKFVVHRGGTAGMLSFAYLENFLPDGTTLELMTAPASLNGAFTGMKAVARAWDGTRPLRSMADLMSDLGVLTKNTPAR